MSVRSAKSMEQPMSNEQLPALPFRARGVTSLWHLIIHYADARVDCDRSRDSVNLKALNEAETNLLAALRAAMAREKP